MDHVESVEVVQDFNINILDNISAYLGYMRTEIKNILADEELQYSEPMEKKKTYPAFTYTQFLYILSRLYDRVFCVNTALLFDNYINKYNKTYSIPKVELCYEVYFRLCGFYGFMCSVEGFYNLTGVDDGLLREWLSCGRSSLFDFMNKNAKNTTVARFENSRIPLLNLAAANYKYKLNEPLTDRQDAAITDSLPDLLAIPDRQKGLPDNQK